MVKDKHISTSSRSHVSRERDRDPIVREKRRRREGESNNSSPSKSPKIDLYKQYIDYEEQEAAKRSNENDVTMFQNVLKNMQQLMCEILDLKLKNSSKSEIADKRTEVYMMFVTLRKLNRLDKLRLNQARNRTIAAKAQVDELNLQLQNLMYEVLHLQKEVHKCLQFKSQDEEVDLVPINEFYENAPVEITRPELTLNDPHQQKLARLEWELKQRQQLAEKCQIAEKQKDLIASQIKQKEEHVNNLGPCLEAILQATQPLQDSLGLKLNKQREQNNLAKHFPSPLYVLYVQTSAYQEACDPLLQIEIVGNLEDFKIVQFSSFDMEIEESDSDIDQEDGKRHKRRAHNKQEDIRKLAVCPHPLTLCLKVFLDDPKAKTEARSLTVTFSYLSYLRIVTVHCSVTHHIMNVVDAELFNSSTVLCDLLGPDRGDRSPNAANDHQLQRLGLEPFHKQVENIGRAFWWAQNLVGLEYPQALQDSSESSLILTGIGALEQVVQAIRKRLEARLALHKQIDSLGRLVVSVAPEMNEYFPAKVVSRVSSWRVVQWEDYCVAPSVQHLIRCGLVNNSFFFYRAVVTREKGTAQLIALIALPPNYPDDAPLFTLSLHWRGERTANTWYALRELEAELNVYWEDLSFPRHHLLSHQIHRLLLCTDILLETECLAESPAEYIKSDKIYFRAARSRHHSKPYKYIPRLGIFTHR